MLFGLSLSGTAWMATECPSTILPPRAQKFFYYLDATSSNCDYKNTWERVADSLILSTTRSQETNRGVAESRLISWSSSLSPVLPRQEL